MAQTLKFGNGNFATKAGSTLCYDDQNGNFKPIPMDFTRASTATRVNKQGLIEVVKSNVPRIDYTDTTNGVLLLEKAATNVLLQSNGFGTSPWSVGNSIVTPNSEISPSGNLDAWKIQSTAVNSETRVRQSYSYTIGNIVTLSCYMKAGTVNFGIIRTYAISGGGRVWFDLENGVVGTKNTGLTGKIENYGNGWYRCSITGTIDTTGAIDFAPSYADNEYLSNAVGENIYIFGGQLEINSSQASSYIPTQGSATTRVAETANGAGNSEVFNNIEGTIFLDANFKNNSGVQVLCSVHDFATDKRLEIWANSNLINGFIGGSSSITVGSSNIINGSHKIALSYKSGNSSFYIDGFLIGSSSSPFTISALTKMNLSYLNPAQYSSECPTKEIGYYNTILTDLELETLTSYRTWTSMVNELNLNIIYNG